MDNPQKIARLGMRLKGFADPDTTSQFEGYLDPGTYIVQEFRRNWPDASTDYARILAPALGAGDTWICIRWEDQKYADIIDASREGTERRSFDGDSLAVNEDVLISLLPAFQDFTYDLDEARYPFELPGVRLPLAPPRSNNCCTFVEALLVRAWADTVDTFQWNSERHRQMMILSNDDYFSPVTAAIETGMAIPAPDPDTPPHPWTLIQGWRHQWRDGHTFLVLDHDESSDRVLTLESNSSYRLNGVGFRQIGNLRDVEVRPPSQWWQDEALWTWDRVKSTYRYRQMAWLKVKNRNWCG